MKIVERTRGRGDVLVPAAVIALAFAVVAAVWVLTGWWSFGEQTGLAHFYGFRHPAVLFWATDGFAAGSALVALAAAIDNRPAPGARLGYVLALAASAWFNAEAATARLGGIAGVPPVALGMAAGVPIVSFLALEVILRAIRATVRRWRGLPAPVGVPGLRPGRLLLAPRSSFREWRAMYLDVTRPGALPVVQADSIRTDIAAGLDALGRSLRADYRTELASVAAIVPPPTGVADDLREEVGTYLRAAEEAAKRTAGEAGRWAVRTAAAQRDEVLQEFRRESRDIEATAVQAAVDAARHAARDVAATAVRDTRPTGATGRTGTGATGTKRARAERAYRDLVEYGTDPAEITGPMLAKAAGDSDPRDTSGYYRKIISDLRPADAGPGAEVVPLGSRSGRV